jgi:6-phospho-3-hexuloisomerase
LAIGWHLKKAYYLTKTPVSSNVKLKEAALKQYPISKNSTKDKMFSLQEILETIFRENISLVKNISEKAAEDLIQSVLNAESIFFCAQGRSGFILRCFCMRLMHLGYRVYFCGETITPAITQKDLLIVLSGSGDTPSTLEAVKRANDLSAETYGILGNMDSKIGVLVNHSLHIPGTTKLCRSGEPESAQMAGSLFEQSAFLFLEAVVFMIYQTRKNDIGSVSSRHAVIE